MTLDIAVLDGASSAELAADPANYVMVACERAKAWLANALEHGDIAQIIELKSQAEAVRIYTQQKELGKDAELSATEIVRRAERGVHLAVERGRGRGEILRRGQTKRRPGPHRVADDDSVNTLADVGIDKYDLANTVALGTGVTDEQFEEAVAEAKDEGNLARANVARKIRDKVGPLSRLQKADKIREMAQQGYTSRQMVASVGLTGNRAGETVRSIARDHNIEIPADRFTHRIKGRDADPVRVVQGTLDALQGIEYGINLLGEADFDAFTPDQVRAWVEALEIPMRALRALSKELTARGRQAD